MEEDNDLDQVTGSPTAGENEFVHTESVDSAQMDGGSINHGENLEQDDGVVVTGIDTIQDGPHDVKTTEDVGHDEFVDCPDALVSGSPGSAIRPHQQPFMFDRVIKQIKESENENGNGKGKEKEIFPHDHEEERKVLMKEVSNLHHQLKVLSKQHSITDAETEEGGEKSILPLREMVNECSKFVETSLDEQSQAEGTIGELYATLQMKDKEIEDLMVKVNDQSTSMSSFEAVTDGILSNLAITFGVPELYDTSVSGKLCFVENSTYFLLEKYSYFLSEVEMLGRCLAEVNSGFQMQNGIETVFPCVREELVGLKRREFELNDKNTLLESQHVQLMEQIEKLKTEVEQEKTRYGNSKEKLSMAVTKGKALVQQRDSLKQTVSENTSELEKCLTELQEKSTALESRNIELTQSQIMANSLQAALLQRDMILTKCAEILSLGLPEATQFPNLESGVSWLLESYNLAKDHFFKLQDENNAIKYHLKREFEEIQYLIYVKDVESKLYEQILDSEMNNRSNEIVKVSEEIQILNDESSLLQINLQKSEEKASLLREKLSLAVKKGKGLVQERENMKQQLAEKNAQIEALMIDFQKLESTSSDFRDQIAKLESERDQIGQFLAKSNTLLQDIVETVDGINVVFPVDIKLAIEKVKYVAMYLSECEKSKTQLEQELEDVKYEAGQLSSKLTESLTTMKSLEELEISKSQTEQELEISREEIGTLNNKLIEALKTLKSLEDKLATSEKTISLLTKDKNELETARCHVEEALTVAENNISVHVNNLDEAKKTIMSLEDGMSLLKANVSDFSQENEKAIDSKALLETEIKKLKEESELEISTLKTELSKCRQELLANHDKLGHEILGFLGNIKLYIKDESLLSLFKQSFEQKIENLKEMDRILKNMKDNFDSEPLQDYPAIEENCHAEYVEFNPEDTENISSYVGKTLDNLNTKNQILTNQFSSFSTLADVIIASLMEKIEATRNTLQQNAKNMQIDKQMVENDIKVLVSVCADVTKDLKFHFENNILQIELEKSNPGVVDDVAVEDVKVAANELYFASRNIRSLIQQHVSVKENMSATIERLQSELEKMSLNYDKSKEVIEGLQCELDKNKLIYEKLEEENDAFQRRVFELEAELEASGNKCFEMSSKLEDYISSVKNHEENALLSASQIKSLFDKIDRITIPFPNLVVGDTKPKNSNSINKLFYVTDNVNDLSDQLTLLTHEKEELRSTLSKQTLEVDHLKAQFNNGFENLIQNFGGDEFVGVKKPADVAGQMSVLEKLVSGIVLDREKSRLKLMETEKIAEELSNKVKLIEDFNKNRTSGPDLIQEGRVFEEPSLPAGSEISEIDDQVSVGKAGLPLVPSAAQMRSLRKGSNEQLAITIDSESDRLLDKPDTVVDKGHIFKSLHTSGLVPAQGKMIADRLDGIWVSGGQALMRQPRARLGVIAYGLVIHLWLLGTIL